jgi:hypothetical protein
MLAHEPALQALPCGRFGTRRRQDPGSELLMRRKIVLAVPLVLSIVLYVVGVVILLTTPQANAIPTPPAAVVGGVLAMFATLGVFITGFILVGTEPG